MTKVWTPLNALSVPQRKYNSQEVRIPSVSVRRSWLLKRDRLEDRQLYLPGWFSVFKILLLTLVVVVVSWTQRKRLGGGFVAVSVIFPGQLTRPPVPEHCACERVLGQYTQLASTANRDEA